MMARIDGRREHARAVDRPLEEGEEAEGVLEERIDGGPEEWDHHENAPEPVDHARDGREQFDEEGHRPPHPHRRKLGQEDRHAERERHRDDEGQGGGDHGAENERQRPELPADRIPFARGEEAEPKLPNGQSRAGPELPDQEGQQHRNGQGGHGEQSLEDAVADPGAGQRRTGRGGWGSHGARTYRANVGEPSRLCNG